MVDFVHKYNDRGNADLTGEKNMLAGLSHNSVGSGDDEDSAVHLSRAGDHVFDIVGVTRAVNVSVVTFVSLILNVSGIDSNSSFSFLGSFVDLVVSFVLSLTSKRKNLCNSGGKSCLTMVDVTDSTDINMGFCSFEFSFCHGKNPPCQMFLFSVFIFILFVSLKANAFSNYYQLFAYYQPFALPLIMDS